MCANNVLCFLCYINISVVFHSFKDFGALKKKYSTLVVHHDDLAQFIIELYLGYFFNNFNNSLLTCSIMAAKRICW